MSLPRRVLWKAADGREFIIDTKEEGLKTIEEIHEHIAKLREKHGAQQPDFMSVVAQPGYDTGAGVDFNDLPDNVKEQVAQAMADVKPDPKKMN